MMNGYGDGSWALMWVWMAAFWGLVLAGTAWLVWSVQRPRSGATEAGEILQQRLARGEIDLEQYRAFARELGASRTAPTRASDRLRVVLLAVAAFSVLTMIAAPAIAAARGDWDMFDHMGGMMGDGRNTANEPPSTGGGAETVIVSDFAFSPGNLRVPVGATVTWTNRDSAPHDATARDDSWRTGRLAKGASGSVTFDRAGVYDYYCSIHPSMKAHLTVE